MASILIVEDDEDIRYLYNMMLERAGYQVHQAPDVTDAINFLDGNRVDVIILDLQMPDHPGVYLVDYLIENERFESAVIVITANDTMADETRRRGVQHVLIKPVNMTDVVELVNTIL